MKRKKSTLPIYAFGITWFVCSAVFPLVTLSSFLLTLGISILVCYLAVLVFCKKVPIAPPADTQPEKAEESTGKYSPEVNKIIEENRRAQYEMGRLYASIANPEIKKKIREIMEISDKIARDAVDDPSDVPAIKKFQSYYLPTTIKLLNSYDRMGAQGIEGENITGAMRSVEEMLDTAITAYKKQLDSLFANQALDIETDIQVMNTLLKRQGLSN